MRTTITSLIICIAVALSGCAAIESLKDYGKSKSKNGGSKTTQKKKGGNKSFATKFKASEVPNTLLKNR